MNIQRHYMRKAAHARAAPVIGGQQRRRGVDFVEPFQNRQRLGQGPMIGDQRRYQPLRVQRKVFGAGLFPFEQ